MAKQIFADPTFDPAPTREQRRLMLTSLDSTRPVDAPAMDIGPDTSDPIGRVRIAAFQALAEGRQYMSITEVIRLASDEQFGGVA
jgi:hypothetical protein